MTDHVVSCKGPGCSGVLRRYTAASPIHAGIAKDDPDIEEANGRSWIVCLVCGGRNFMNDDFPRTVGYVTDFVGPAQPR